MDYFVNLIIAFGGFSWIFKVILRVIQSYNSGFLRITTGFLRIFLKGLADRVQNNF